MNKVYKLAAATLCVMALAACEQEAAQSTKPDKKPVTTNEPTRQESFDKYNESALPAIQDTQTMMDKVILAIGSGELAAIIECNNQSENVPALKRRVLTDVPDRELGRLLSEAYTNLEDGLNACGRADFVVATSYIESYNAALTAATARVEELS